MPRITGEELAAIIAERWPALRVLLLSAHGHPGADYQGSFLAKPFQPDTLLALVSAGKLIGIARREAVPDQMALEGLELCAWCQAKDRTG